MLNIIDTLKRELEIDEWTSVPTFTHMEFFARPMKIVEDIAP